MNQKVQIAIIAVAISIAAVLFYLTPRLSSIIEAGLKTPPPATTSLSAEVSEIMGDVFYRQSHETFWTPVNEGDKIPLHHGDTLKVESRSQAVLVFQSGYELQLQEQTQAALELWNPSQSTSPIYLNILTGDFKLLRRGQPGHLFIVQDRSLFYPSGKPPITGHELIVQQEGYEDESSPNEETNELQASPSPEPEDDLEATVPQRPGEIATSDVIDPSEPPRLSNEYIDQVIASQRDLFQKCQSNSIREKGEAQGQMLVGLTIDNKGKIEEARILSTDMDDQQLHQCVVSVLKRTKFKPFDGPPIVRSYPLLFE